MLINVSFSNKFQLLPTQKEKGLKIQPKDLQRKTMIVIVTIVNIEVSLP